MASFSMKIEYSPAVVTILEKAACLVHAGGGTQIGPIELLQALMDEEEGHPVVRVLAAGVPLDRLRARFPVVASGPVGSDAVRLAPATEAIMAQARDLARTHGAEGSISSEHLLLATLEVDAASRSSLESIGLDFSALKEIITPTAPALRLDRPLDLTPTTETIDTAHILDASANRAREALRVLEDYARFVRGDTFLCRELKTLRHRLADHLGLLPGPLLLQARSTLHDVGTEISTAQEQERACPRDVAQANAKRLQEALRSLEEFGKVLNAEFGQAIERLRYQSYTLERALLAAGDPRGELAAARLYVLVTEASCRTSLAGTVREALAGGAQVVQLREKTMTDAMLLATARDLRKMTRAAGALFIVNDRPDIALLAEADGVHLGQDDLPVWEARRLLGEGAIIGVSTHNMEQVQNAVLEGADYLGVGPTFPSRTKDFGAFPGLEFVKQVADTTALPFFVLGGVTIDNVGAILGAGGTRVALSYEICVAADPRAVALKLRDLLERA